MAMNSSTQYSCSDVLQIYRFHYETNFRNIKITLMELSKGSSKIL